MKSNILSYVLSFVSMLVIDLPWLLIMSKKVYSVRLAHLLAEKPQLLPALLFYLIYPLGILFFVSIPAFRYEWSVGKVALMGALLGLIAYGTYDLTNNATLNNWPYVITIIDIIWGALLTSLVSILSFVISNRIR